MAAHPKVTPAVKKRYVELYEQCGLQERCARAVGTTGESIRKHRELDPDFDDACTRAYSLMRDNLEREVRRRGVYGVLEPVFYQGMIVGHKLIYSDRMLELHVKRHIPEYREKIGMDLNVTGGVLVVPHTPESDSEWENRYRGNGRGSAVPQARQ